MLCYRLLFLDLSALWLEWILLVFCLLLSLGINDCDSYHLFDVNGGGGVERVVVGSEDDVC